MKLNYWRTICVGFAFFLICAFWQAYDSIIPKILTDKFGMAQGWSGVIMALDNILALFMLPIFGAISDKCRSKHGKRTPFIVVGTIIAVVAFIALSFIDNAQLCKLDTAANFDFKAVNTVYEDAEIANATLKTHEGEEYVLSEKYTEKELGSIVYKASQGDAEAAAEWEEYFVPARQAYAAKTTANNRMILVAFMAVLLVTLVAMSVFRSPAVALMPDVTIKPLRSKANAVINLMGSFGGILVLGLGMVFGTGKTQNAMMSYILFFTVIAAIMVIALIAFLILRWLWKRLSARAKESSDAGGTVSRLSLNEEERSEEPLRRRDARTPALKIRFYYRKVLQLLHAAGGKTAAGMTTEEQLYEELRLIPDVREDAEELRALYLPARYGEEAAEADAARARELYHRLRAAFRHKKEAAT